MQQVVGEDVIGAQRHHLRHLAKRQQGLGELGQQMRMRAAQLDGEPSLQLGNKVGGRGQLVIRLDPGGGETGKVAARQAPAMAAQPLAAGQGCIGDAGDARVAVQQRVHGHQLGRAMDVVAGQPAGHHIGVEIGARGLVSRGRGHAGRHQWHQVQGHGGRLGAGMGKARLAHHVGQLMRVPEGGGHAARHNGLGIGGGADHGAFDVHMRVDETGHEALALGVQHLCRIRAATRRMDRGDQRANQPDIGGAEAASDHVHHLRAGDQQVERRQPAGGTHRAGALFGVVQVLRKAHLSPPSSARPDRAARHCRRRRWQGGCGPCLRR